MLDFTTQTHVWGKNQRTPIHTRLRLDNDHWVYHPTQPYSIIIGAVDFCFMFRSAGIAGILQRASTTACSTEKSKIPVCWLDLRGTGLSILERLCLEECILQKEQSAARHWVIVGHHEPVRHKFFKEKDVWTNTALNVKDGRSAWDVDATTRNESSAVVLGIGGKPDQLLNLDSVRRDNVLTIKRFSGGGTVVLDYDSIWTTIIGRRDDLVSEHFPRPIMKWSADTIFEPMFERLAVMQRTKSKQSSTTLSNTTMVVDTKSCGIENSGRMVTRRKIEPESAVLSTNASNPQFQLRENDYVIGERKIGGNAQSIGKMGFLHHTSFLWDFNDENMDYLSLPSKRPEYRGDRSHNDFLVKLKDVYPDLRKGDFYGVMLETCREAFDVESVSLRDAMTIVDQQGGMKSWFDQGSRTKVLRDL